MISTDGRRTPLPEILPRWDISTSLDLERELSLDAAAFRTTAGLPDPCRIQILVAWGSDFDGVATSLEVTLSDQDEIPISLQATIPGDLLGDVVRVTTSAVLRDQLTPEPGPKAWRVGSVLWRDIKRVRLHGDSSRFPVAVAAFEDLNLDPRLPWHLELDADLSAPAMGAVHLLINSRFELVIEAARNFDEARTDLKAIRSTLNADVGRLLVEHLLLFDDPTRDEWPDDSLGDVLRSLLAARVDGAKVDLDAERTHQPAVWHDRLASSFGLLHGVE